MKGHLNIKVDGRENGNNLEMGISIDCNLKDCTIMEQFHLLNSIAELMDFDEKNGRRLSCGEKSWNPKRKKHR